MTELRIYMALLTLYENNMRAIHWRLAGTGFQTAHERFGGYYDKLGEMLDETAEVMMSIGQTPIHMYEAMSLLTEAQDVHASMINSGIDISEKVADEWAKSMFDQLYEIAAEYAGSGNLPVDVADVFMGQAKWFRIEGKYKLMRATTNPTTEEEGQSQTPAPIEAPPSPVEEPEPEVTEPEDAPTTEPEEPEPEDE